LQNPPAFFDGTIIAQKSIIRQSITRGRAACYCRLYEVPKRIYLRKAYQNLKTYGIGQDLSWYDWNQYLIQLINLGYCEIASSTNKIRLTSFAAKYYLRKSTIDNCAKTFDGEK
jgi:ATP-dependent DNA helicase RecQ